LHEHNHGNQRSRLSQKRVLAAMAVTGVILAAEVVGGVLTNSLALLSDAGHMLTDLLALGLSYFAISLARRPPTDEKTYGFHRMEILAALVNGATLVAICLLIFYEAFQRINNPPEVKTAGMLVIAVIGLVANLISAAILFTGWFWVDPLISAGIGVIIVFGAYNLVRESVDVLLEATPGHIALDDVRTTLQAIPGVLDVHDLHVWCLTPQICSLSTHLVIADVMTSRSDQTLREINRLIADRFQIEHTTIQFECDHCQSGDANGCVLAAR
jgi:cobalt-zinc-cadmium efflux system protein